MGGWRCFSSSIPCVTACQRVFLAQSRGHVLQPYFNGLEMQSVARSQTCCSLIHTGMDPGRSYHLQKAFGLCFGRNSLASCESKPGGHGYLCGQLGDRDLRSTRAEKLGQDSVENSAGAYYVEDQSGGTYNLKIMDFNSLLTPASCFECLQVVSSIYFH